MLAHWTGRALRGVQPGAATHTRPSTPLAKIDPRHIYGRFPELRCVLRELENGNSVAVRGQKRAGKSTFGALLVRALTHRHIALGIDMRSLVHLTPGGDVVGALAEEVARQFSDATGVVYDGPARSLREVLGFIERNQGSRLTVLVIDEIRALVDALSAEDLNRAFRALEGALPPDCSPTQQVYIVHRDFEDLP